MSHWHTLNIFPEPLIALNREVLNHPKLMEYLGNHESAEWEIKIAEICLYCEVIVDGIYLPEEMENLCSILVGKLIERRVDNRSLVIIKDI